MAGSSGEDRVFVRPRKHYRKRYSTTEVRLGVAVVVALVTVGAWVAWRGKNPDPELLGSGAMMQRRGPEALVEGTSPEKVPGHGGAPEGEGAKSGATTDRGPLPAGLAPEGWSERGLSVFDTTNLYVKINGREGYYKSFNFQKLHFLTLAAGEATIDLELYDLGDAMNALGAAAGELPEGARPEFAEGTLALLDRNALYLARGRYYLRAIGSAEDDAIKQALGHVRRRMTTSLDAEPLPWSYALFVGLGVAPSKVSYSAENAFSFGFAKDVHAGLLPDGDTELFVVASKDAAAATALARQFAKGFAEYGTLKEEIAGAQWIEDRYLSRYSGVTATGRFVVGVRSAADPKAGAERLTKLRAAVEALPADLEPTAKPEPTEEPEPTEKDGPEY